jgi:ABC-type polysaccharide/polyol phosphate transport system ATPase subunit
MSLAFDFDVYISDEVTSAGDAAFRKKASAAFKRIADHAGLIMVAHSEGTLRQFCQAGIWLHEGHATLVRRHRRRASSTTRTASPHEQPAPQETPCAPARLCCAARSSRWPPSPAC